ncbi:hypothetical protein GW17_00003187 [Ensete ventricosum]|nr:hypothetical protein GW17_00003187 [Ensete ventricosum]
MAAPPPLTLKRSYRSVSSLQQFYSGGPFAVSSDGASLACACGEEIKIVNTSDASVLASLGGDSESVTAFAFSPDGCFLFSAGHSRLVRVWDVSSRKCVRSWKILLSAGRDKQQSSDVTLVSNEDDMRRGFLSAVVLPSDLGLLCVTADQQFLFYCPMKSAEGMFQLNLYKRLVGYNEEILDMKFLGDDEQYVAVATNLEQVRLWDVESRHCIGIGRGHMGAVGAVAFSKKSKNFLVSGSSFEGVSEDGDQEIALKAKAVVAAHDKDINSLAVSPNDSGDGLIKLWTIKTKLISFKRVKSSLAFTYFCFCFILQIWALAVGKKTEMLVTGGTDALINFWHDSTAADKQEAFLRELFLFQVKGVSELLEGLIPYSQRHFSRIDRFVRSIFLLDYVLARMSVVDPEETILPRNGEQHPLASENGVADEQDASQSNIQVDDISCKDDTGKSSTCDEMDGMTSLKKRKSSKSKKGSAKKVKLTKHKNNSTISVEA